MQHLPENLAAALFSFGASRILRIRRPHILVACMPKSASSYLTTILGNVGGLRRRSIAHSFKQREQEIDPLRAAMRSLVPYVAQQHVRFSEGTNDLLRTFGIAPIVLTRNLFDVVVSLRDHVRKHPEIPMAWFTKEHAKLADTELEAAITNLVIPWYINFYVSWHSCPQALWISYDDVTKKTPGTIRSICDHVSISASDRDIDDAILKANKSLPRWNVGTTGRGEALAPETKSALRRLCSYYPEIDFTKVGIYPSSPADECATRL